MFIASICAWPWTIYLGHNPDPVDWLSLCPSKDMPGDGGSRLAVAAPLPVLLAPRGEQGPAPGASIPKEQPSLTGVQSD